MEGRHGEPVPGAALDQPPDAFLHLARGLVGEGQRADGARRQPALADQVGDLAGDDAGLAGAGAGNDQQRAADVAHGLALAWVQSFHPRNRR
jgi:hypothetical protein